MDDHNGICIWISLRRVPFHFGEYEFHGRKPAAQMGASLVFYGKGGIMRTAGNAVIIDSVIDSFDFQFVFQRNISFFKGCFQQQVFIYFNGIECRIPRKILGLISGCFWKKSIRIGINALESARLLPSSGESDFSQE